MEQQHLSGSDYWVWRVFQIARGSLVSVSNAYYWKQLRSGDPPCVYRNAALRALHALDAAYPEGLSDELMRELKAFVQMCTVQGACMNELAHLLQTSSRKWKKRQERPDWKQYVLDVNPFEWTWYFVSTRVLGQQKINPVLRPTIELEKSQKLFDLACSHMGKCYYFLDALQRGLGARPTLSPEDLDTFIVERLRKMVTIFNFDLASHDSDTLFSLIDAQLETELVERPSDITNGTSLDTYHSAK